MHKHVILEEIGTEFFNREGAVSHFYDKRVCDHPVPQVVVLMTKLLGQCHNVRSFCLLTTLEAVREGIPSLDMAGQQSVRLQPLGKALPLGGILHAERGLVRLPQRCQ